MEFVKKTWTNYQVSKLMWWSISQFTLKTLNLSSGLCCSATDPGHAGRPLQPVHHAPHPNQPPAEKVWHDSAWLTAPPDMADYSGLPCFTSLCINTPAWGEVPKRTLRLYWQVSRHGHQGDGPQDGHPTRDQEHAWHSPSGSGQWIWEQYIPDNLSFRSRVRGRHPHDTGRAGHLCQLDAHDPHHVEGQTEKVIQHSFLSTSISTIEQNTNLFLSSFHQSSILSINILKKICGKDPVINSFLYFSSSQMEPCPAVPPSSGRSAPLLPPDSSWSVYPWLFTHW